VSVVQTLLVARGPVILLAVDETKKRADEEMKVRIGPDGDLVRITKLMDPETAFGEYIGASLIEGSAVPRLADALRATFERDPDLYYEDGYQEMVDRGEQIRTASIPSGTPWVEVDNQADLTIAREIACHY
jgi:choline kinase